MAEQLEKAAQRAHMYELRQKLAKAKDEQRQEEEVRLHQEELKLKEESRIKDIRRRAVIEK